MSICPFSFFFGHSGSATGRKITTRPGRQRASLVPTTPGRMDCHPSRRPQSCWQFSPARRAAASSEAWRWRVRRSDNHRQGRANAKSPDRMGGIVKRRLAMATLPCLGPSPRPSALTMPPVVREGRHPQHGRFQDFAFALIAKAFGLDDATRTLLSVPWLTEGP